MARIRFERIFQISNSLVGNKTLFWCYQQGGVVSLSQRFVGVARLFVESDGKYIFLRYRLSRREVIVANVAFSSCGLL